MRTIFFLTSILFMGLMAQSQEILTPEKLKKITAEADAEAVAYKKTLKESDGQTAAWIDFSTDTFRINRISDKRMEVDFSTHGMNQTVMATTEAYDLLLNKYYNKLMGLLKGEDKKVLVAAQRAWLVFRDAEKKLIGVTRKEEYSGGGTIQSNIFTGLYASMIEERAIAIFNYYDEIIKE